MLEQPKTPRKFLDGMCKNHSDTKSGYFVVEQPWIKYCKNCALNIALCGKKIEKELNSKEFDNKMTLFSITSEMKRVISQA
jgi:hypothetical protein